MHCGKLALLSLIMLAIEICFALQTEGKEFELFKRPSYVYTSEGKPDPFEPFVLKEEVYKSLSPEELEKLKLIPSLKTELQRISIKELKVVAMIKIGNKVLAMVQGPTGKGYIVKPGIGIGTKGGIVDKIVYKEELTPLGKKVIKKIIIKEPFIDKNKKISFRYIELTMGEK